MRKVGIVLAFFGGFLVLGLAVSQLSGGSSSGGPASVNDLARAGAPPLIDSTSLGNDDSDGEADSTGTPYDSAESVTTLTSDALTGDQYAPAPALPATGSLTVTGAGANVSALPQLADRKIIRTATVEVTVDDVSGAVQLIENRAQAAGGFVSGSSLTVEAPEQPAGPSATPTPERQRATVTIRVPAETYAAVMSDIRALGDVKTETSDTSEVTEEYTDLEARLRNLQATEQQYLELLGRAEVIPDILTVQDRLNSNRLEIEQVKGRLQLLDDLTDLATITVTLTLPPALVDEELRAKETTTEPGWAEEAWDDAWNESQDALETLGVAGITAAVILVWLLVPAAALGIAWRVFSLFARRHPA